MFEESIDRFKTFWNDRGLEFLFAVSVIVIIMKKIIPMPKISLKHLPNIFQQAANRKNANI